MSCDFGCNYNVYYLATFSKSPYIFCTCFNESNTYMKKITNGHSSFIAAKKHITTKSTIEKWDQHIISAILILFTFEDLY
jgi:hypothetical protein